ncbi:MAG: hypothetical protein ACLVG5_02195 [Clostridium sp.]
MNKTGLYADVILPATAWGETKVFIPVRTVASESAQADRAGRDMRQTGRSLQIFPQPWDINDYKNTEEIWNEMIDLCQALQALPAKN